jgi:hypothetical protein
MGDMNNDWRCASEPETTPTAAPNEPPVDGPMETPPGMPHLAIPPEERSVPPFRPGDPMETPAPDMAPPPPSPAASSGSNRAILPMLAAVGIIGGLSMVAMKAYHRANGLETEQAVVAANNDLQTLRTEMTERYEQATETNEPVRPDVSRIDETIAIMERTAERARGNDAKIARCMAEVLADFRPVLVEHAQVFDEVMTSDQFGLSSLTSPEQCDTAIVAFMRFRTSVERVCGKVDEFPRSLEKRLVEEGVPFNTANAASRQLSHSLTANTLIQRLDAEIASVVIDLYSLLKKEWGAWSLGPDDGVRTDDAGLEAEIDHMLRRINRLERSQQAALRRQQSVSGR